VLGRFVTRHFTAMNDPGSLVIQIPLHRRRYLLRRYNQSAELAGSARRIRAKYAATPPPK
jgi:predicted amidophosphoribosyltransferase